MQYSLGESLANTGFTFYEKIHEPIFLVHRRCQRGGAQVAVCYTYQSK
jgi:hypothetical protein